MSEMHWPEITKDTPLTEVKRIHQAIWDYVIEHGEKPNTPYMSNCIACEYAHWILFRNCDCCPVYWPAIKNGSRFCTGCFSGDGLYSKWCLNKLNVQLAKQIRDLPFKYELEEKKNV